MIFRTKLDSNSPLLGSLFVMCRRDCCQGNLRCLRISKSCLKILASQKLFAVSKSADFKFSAKDCCDFLNKFLSICVYWPHHIPNTNSVNEHVDNKCYLAADDCFAGAADLVDRIFKPISDNSIVFSDSLVLVNCVVVRVHLNEVPE